MNSEERLLNVLLAPHVSEKTAQAQVDRKYTFRVIADATKKEIGKAVELLFKVNVTDVRVCNVRGKAKTFGRIKGKQKGWKKAYVKIKEGQSIDFGSVS